MKANKRKLATGIAVAVIAIAMLVETGCQSGGRIGGTSATTGEAVTVTRQSLVVQVEATGTLQPAREANLTFGTAGRVAEVLISEGDTVAANQELARLDTKQLELAVRDAEDTLALRQSALRQAQQPPNEHDLATVKPMCPLRRTTWQNCWPYPTKRT